MLTLSSFLLFALCTFTSTATSALGAAGGTMLLAFMPALVSPALVIPLHGATQLVSNSSRMVLDWRMVPWRRVMLPFLPGSFIGAVLGYQFLDAFNFDYLPLILAVFILIITWTRLVQRFSSHFSNMPVLGGILTCLSLFVGAIGNTIMPILLGLGYPKNQAIVTQAAMMSVVHLVKLFSYVAIGFAFMAHLPTMLTMMAGSLAGSLIGKHLRGRIPEAAGVLWIKVLTTLAAFYLVYHSVATWK